MIGIALVPPLCVVGFGIGTASGEITSGAALLFIANFSAIVLVAVLSFLDLGYNQVPAHLGPPLGASAEEMLARALAAPLRATAQIVDVPLPATALTAPANGDSAWLAGALAVLGELPRVDSVVACVTRPAARLATSRGATTRATPPRSGGRPAAVEAILLGTEAGRAGRLFVIDGSGWTIRVSSTCVQVDSGSTGMAAGGTLMSSRWWTTPAARLGAPRDGDVQAARPLRSLMRTPCGRCGNRGFDRGE